MTYASRGKLILSRKGREVNLHGLDRIQYPSTKDAWYGFSDYILSLCEISSIAGYRPEKGGHRKLFRSKHDDRFFILESSSHEKELFFECADKDLFFAERDSAVNESKQKSTAKKGKK